MGINELYHYGVKGMKWRHRKNGSQEQTISGEPLKNGSVTLNGSETQHMHDKRLYPKPDLMNVKKAVKGRVDEANVLRGKLLKERRIRENFITEKKIVEKKIPEKRLYEKIIGGIKGKTKKRKIEKMPRILKRKTYKVWRKITNQD